MSWREAPLYVEAHDLAAWVMERVNAWAWDRDRNLAPLVAAAASELLAQISLALTFPGTRSSHLEQADHAVVRLRVLLRLSHQLGLLSAGSLRFASGRLQAVGRMIGGWRKRFEHPTEGDRNNQPLELDPGGGPPAARGA